VLILPPGHARSISTPRRLRAREQWIIGSVLALLAAGVVVLVISFASSGHTTGHGCIDVTVPGATGGTEIYRCGAEARALCASAATAGSQQPLLGEATIAQCRKAGIPTG
jgi:hypothetical protein